MSKNIFFFFVEKFLREIFSTLIKCIAISQMKLE